MIGLLFGGAAIAKLEQRRPEKIAKRMAATAVTAGRRIYPSRSVTDLGKTVFQAAQDNLPLQALGLNQYFGLRLRMWVAWWVLETQKETLGMVINTVNERMETLDAAPYSNKERELLRKELTTLLKDLTDSQELTVKAQEPAEDARG